MAAVMTGYHHAHLTVHPARAVVWKEIADYLEPYVPADADVLEIGAGYCAWINHVRARRRVAVDLWDEMPRYAAAGVRAVIMDVATDLRTFGPESFDVVLASNVLEHFHADAAAGIVGDIFGLLRPRGCLIVIQPNFARVPRRYFDDYTHRSVFTHVSLAALLRSRGFAVDRVAPRFLPYSMQGTRLPIRDWLVRAYLRLPFRPGAGQMLVVARKP